MFMENVNAPGPRLSSRNSARLRVYRRQKRHCRSSLSAGGSILLKYEVIKHQTQRFIVTSRCTTECELCTLNGMEMVHGVRTMYTANAPCFAPTTAVLLAAAPNIDNNTRYEPPTPPPPRKLTMPSHHRASGRRANERVSGWWWTESAWTVARWGSVTNQ